MKPAVLLIVVLGLAVGAYVLLNDSTGSDDAGTPTPLLDSGVDGGTDAKKGDGKSATLKAAPSEEPKQLPKSAQLHTPAAVLLIARHSDQWTETVIQAFDAVKELRFATWILATADGAPTAGKAHGMSAPSKQPDGAYLEENDIRALFFDSADPNALSKACWDTIARRVRSGRMGLFVRPNFPQAIDSKSPAPAIHPALTHPVLRELLPVAKAKELRGNPVPGVYTRQAQALVVSADGVKHPATRFVTNPEDSQAAWTDFMTGDGAIQTRFVYPVTELKPGAKTLIDLELGDYPAVVVSAPGNARVLWMGNGSFGSGKGSVYFFRQKHQLQTILISKWLMWLVGQAVE